MCGIGTIVFCRPSAGIRSDPSFSWGSARQRQTQARFSGLSMQPSGVAHWTRLPEGAVEKPRSSELNAASLPRNPQLKLGADKVPAEAGSRAACRCLSRAHDMILPFLVSGLRISWCTRDAWVHHLFCRPSAGIRSDPSFSWGSARQRQTQARFSGLSMQPSGVAHWIHCLKAR